MRNGVIIARPSQTVVYRVSVGRYIVAKGRKEDWFGVIRSKTGEGSDVEIRISVISQRNRI